MRLKHNGRDFADGIFKRILLNENCIILIKISLILSPKGSFDNIPELVQIMAWHRSGDLQAIIWIIDDLVYWRIYASLSLNELKNIII